MPLPIPSPDPIPLPAPVALLKFLLIFTFILHILAMNLALGGGVITAVSHWRGRLRRSQRHLRLAEEISHRLPPAMALTITLGIAPLLFVQVLYGQFFYTSSILLGWVWLGMLGLLLLGYYGYYWYAFRWQQLGAAAAWVITAAVALLSVIPVIFTTNVTLMLQPERWQALYVAGSHWNWGDPAVVPRFLHFLVASVAVAALGVLLHGLTARKRDPDYASWVRRYAALWFVAATVVQYGVGIWFLTRMPKNIWTLFLGGSPTATGVFSAAVLLSLVAIILVVVSCFAQKAALPALTGVGSLVGTVCLMAVMRDIVRDAYLAPYFRPQELVVVPQWGVVILFAVLLVAGLGVVGYMLSLFRSRPAAAAGD
jgi:hypothetical protein